jgi:hypothetical protein
MHRHYSDDFGGNGAMSEYLGDLGTLPIVDVDTVKRDIQDADEDTLEAIKGFVSSYLAEKEKEKENG